MSRKVKLSWLFGVDFLSLYRCESNARGKVRLLALHHVQQGKEIKEVSKMLCVTCKTVSIWLSWYKDGGIKRILSKPIGRGCKKKIELAKEELQSGITTLQEERAGGRIIGDDIIEWIKENYQTEYSKGHVYNLLKSMGISWISVRSKHPKHNLEAQESFKKNL